LRPGGAPVAARCTAVTGPSRTLPERLRARRCLRGGPVRVALARCRPPPVPHEQRNRRGGSAGAAAAGPVPPVAIASGRYCERAGGSSGVAQGSLRVSAANKKETPRTECVLLCRGPPERHALSPAVGV